MVLLSGIAVAAGACGGDQGSANNKSNAKAPSAVAIRDFVFAPRALTVKPGSKVTWTNEDGSPHAIKDQSTLATPESPPLAQGDTFSITYPKAGTYPYICGIHNYMTGSVEVTG
jgi:plastocyanin